MHESESSIQTPAPTRGAAYIRYSSRLQEDSFSLDAQLRQIQEQAEKDGVGIVSVFSDPATSAYSKKYRPGIRAMREAAHRGEFEILYVHKVDRLARRLEWCLEIVHELQSLDINFKAVEHPFDLNTPEGKLLFHLISSLGEFYSDNLSRETHKGKLESALQGFHNGEVPWGYLSKWDGNRKVGMPDPEKAPIVKELFECYATGLYTDAEMADWLNKRGQTTNRGNPFTKDTVRDMLCNPYFNGKIRYRGMSVRRKGVSYRSTPPKLVEGQHEPIVSNELWGRAQRVRTSRRPTGTSRRETIRVFLLQGIIVCAHCGRCLRAQSNGGKQAYYRDESRRTGSLDCPFFGKGIRASVVDHQISLLMKSLRLPENWEGAVARLLYERGGRSKARSCAAGDLGYIASHAGQL